MEFHLFVHFDNSFGSGLTNLIQEINKMAADLTALTAQVTANNTLIESAITLINGLAAQIIALKNDPVALQALADSLKKEDDTLAAALVANTPANG